MHGQPEHFSVADRLQLAQPLGQHPALLLGQGVYVGWSGTHDPSQQIALGLLVQRAAGQVHHAHLMLAAPQPRHDLRRAGKRDGAFRGGAPP